MSEQSVARSAGDTDNPDDVLRHIPALRAYARSLSNQPDDADDLLQATLLKAMANIEKYQSGTNLRAWLFTIMRNTFLTDVRKRAREGPGIADCASGVPACAPVHDEHIAGQRLLAAMERLPQHYREVLILVIVLGESYEEAGRICGCAIGTVKSRINRARARLIADLGSTSYLDYCEGGR